MAAPYVLGFVGENANGILRWWTTQILEGFARYGFAYRLVNMEGDWRDELIGVLGGGMPAFCFSFQGFGMNLKNGGGNYWAQHGVPFISYLGDNPYHCPSLHAAEGPGLYLLYSCQDFFQTYREVLGGSTFASIVRYNYPRNPYADEIRWVDRPHQVVFVKTGIDPARFHHEWESLPRVTRTILHESAEQVLSGSDETITTICRSAFERHHIHYGAQRELLLYACSSVDRYARAIRAERMTRHLMRQNALIVGDWSHLDQSEARARFAPALPAERLDMLYAEARLIVNTSPSVRHGIHERIMAGLLAKSAVLSDSTPFLHRALQNCPAFYGVDIDAADFADRLDTALRSALLDPEMPDKVAASFAEAARLFSMESFIDMIMEHVHIENHRRAIAGWVFSPSDARSSTQPA